MGTESQRYLDAFRRATAGGDDVRAANLAAIRDRLRRGERVYEHDPEHEHEHVEPRFRRAASFVLIAKPVALSIGIAAAGVGTIKVGAMTYAAVTTPEVEAVAEPEPTPQETSPVSERASRVAPSPALDTTPIPEVVSPVAPPPSVETPSAEPEPTTTAPRSRTGSRTAPPPTDELRREIALMERAQTELQGERYDTLLVTLAEHARTFEHGAMVLERHGWAAIAHCRLGHHSAQTDADAFLRRHGGTALAQKVRRACDKSDPGAISSDG